MENQSEVINELRFVSYLVLFDMHHPSGEKYFTQKGENISGSSDEWARATARVRAEELTRKDNDGIRYEFAELKKIETHHKVTRIPI